MVSARISRVRWARNNARPRMLAMASKKAPVTEMTGTNPGSPSTGLRTLRSTVKANANEDMKSARVKCTNRSATKVRSKRGENWLLASCRVTTVSENVNEVTVISDPAMASSTDRAASGPPLKRSAERIGGSDPSRVASKVGSAVPATSANTTAKVGTGHSCVRTASMMRAVRPFIADMAALESSFARSWQAPG